MKHLSFLMSQDFEFPFRGHGEPEMRAANKQPLEQLKPLERLLARLFEERLCRKTVMASRQLSWTVLRRQASTGKERDFFFQKRGD
jgi:hypothetical protein